LKSEDLCEKVEIAGKGFINFYIKDEVWRTLLKNISDGNETLYPNLGNGKKVLIEFVSANPTGLFILVMEEAQPLATYLPTF
jgi:arginyl-tRNA synthetase